MVTDFEATGAYRATYGDYFGIGVAGYPEAHPDVISDDPVKNEESYQKDLAYLKQKVPSPPLLAKLNRCAGALLAPPKLNRCVGALLAPPKLNRCVEALLAPPKLNRCVEALLAPPKVNRCVGAVQIG